MYIKCWGARGSSPVSGNDYLKYGGNTSCVEVRAGDPEQTILIDFGTGALPMGRELVKRGCTSISALVTHSHWDHVMGFPLFSLLFVPGSEITFYYNPTFQGNPRKLVSRDMMASPHFPVSLKDIPANIYYREVGRDFSIGPVAVSTIPLSHPNLGLGYRLECGGKSLVFLTDNEPAFKHRGGKSMEEYAGFCRKADLLIHDAELFTEKEYQKTKGFGHSSVDQAINLARKAGVKSLALFHHNRERTDQQIDTLVARLNHEIKTSKLRILALAQDQEIRL